MAQAQRRAETGQDELAARIAALRFRAGRPGTEEAIESIRVLALQHHVGSALAILRAVETALARGADEEARQWLSLLADSLAPGLAGRFAD